MLVCKAEETKAEHCLPQTDNVPLKTSKMVKHPYLFTLP